MTSSSRRAPGERGSATIFIVGFMIVLFGAAGLAIDGGRAINARSSAADAAEQAARAGASAIDVPLLRATGEISLDRPAAEQAARNYLTVAGFTDYTVRADPGAVTVRVAFSKPTALLGIIGINSIPVSGEATAAPVTGIGGAGP